MSTEYRSKRYTDFLRQAFIWSQYSLTKAAEDLSHPPRHRPWIAEISPGRFSQGKAKGSDYGCLMLTHLENMRESASDKLNWGLFLNTIPTRDLIAATNMITYVERELDPGIDLWAEMVEFAQKRVAELEEQNGL